MRFFYYLLIALLLSTSIASSQKDGSKFLNKISEDKTQLEMPKAYHRFVEFMKERAYPGTEIDRDNRIRAIKDTEKILKQKNNKLLMHAQQPVWENIGPYNVGGRVKAVEVHPTDPDIVYIGAAAGGIWRSKDGGSNWKTLFDFESAIAVGALSIDRNDPNIIYAGTGEPVVGFAKDFRGTPTYLGYGLYKSTDAGDTWEYLALSDVGAFSRIFVHPLNSDLIYAGAVERNSGFYVSTDKGETWDRTRTENVTDVGINPDDPNEVIIGVRGRGIFYSSDMGKTWQDRSGKFKDNCSRVSVQVSISNPSIYYTLLEEGADRRARIYRTDDKGLSWTQVYYDNSSDGSFFNGQGGYDNCIAIKPDDPSIVLAGGIDVWRTMNSGGGWSNVTYGYAGGTVHVDQQCMAFSLSNPSIVYIGNDGGMYKSLNAGQTYININNDLQVTQFYAMGIDHKRDNINYGGTQDNGTLGKINNGFWSRVEGGDGFRTFVHPDNSNLVYGEYYYGRMWEFNLETNRGKYFVTGIPSGDQGAWCSPFIPDHNNPGVFYHGRRAVYGYYYSGSWYRLTDYYETTFSALAVSRADYANLYAGNSDGTMLYSSDMGETWEDQTRNGLINRFITYIETCYEDPAVAYVTYSGYGNPHVYMTADNGKQWTDISQNLPDVPVSSIAVNPKNPDNLYVATDIGIFTTYDRGEIWLPFGKGLPRVPVLEIEFRRLDNFDELILRAATHGRSMWECVVPDEPVTEPEITSPTGGEHFTSGANELIAWYGFTEPVKIEFSYDNGSSWKEIANNVIGNKALWKVDHYETDVARIRITSNENPAQSLTTNIFTIKLLEKGGVIANSFVNYIPYGVAWDRQGGLWTSAFDDKHLYKLDPETFELIKKVELPGDSLFTDLTIDRTNGRIYLHKLTSTTEFIGGDIVIVDTNGTFIKKYSSPANKYPIGIEIVDGLLIVADREYPRMLTTIDPASGAFISEVKNPYDKSYGPRGLCYDGDNKLYQICTFFPGGGSLTEALLIKFDKANMSEYSESMALEDNNGMINARGIEFDNRDKSFWVTDFNGSLYKIAGFDYILDVEDHIADGSETLSMNVFPNPAMEFTNISFNYNGKPADISISVINTLGNIVGEYFDEFVSDADRHLVHINTSEMESGVYYIVYSINGVNAGSRKLSVVR
jgi:photosystem II stability/assembly factor-like uncharacterized protein